MRVVIRKLAPDELVWFLARALAFQGHSDAMALAQRLGPRLRAPRHDAERTFIWTPGRETPRAGMHLRRPGPDDDDRTARLGPGWYQGDPEAGRTFLTTLLDRTPHEAAVLDLAGVPSGSATRFEAWLAPLGFRREARVRMRFPLSDVPPLGRPLVLEAWSEEADPHFRQVYRAAERVPASDRYWAWLKRRGGPFRPHLWFLLRPAPDRAPVGYAFCHGAFGPEVSFRLEAAGVLPEHRDSTEMLRRVVLTTLHELAARAPAGTLTARPDAEDPKLARILTLLGFREEDREAHLVRSPS